MKLFSIAVACLLFFCHAAHADKRLALVVGNQYGDARISEVPGASEDVAHVSSALERIGFEVTTLTNASRQEFMSAYAAYVSSVQQSDDVVVSMFYFTGHGFGVSAFGENFIVANDTRLDETSMIEDVAWDGISLKDVANGIAQSPNVISSTIVVDAARVTTLGATSRSPKATGLEGKELALTTTIFSVTPGATAPPARDGVSVFAETFAALITRPGQTATRFPNELSYIVAEETDFLRRPFVLPGQIGDFYYSPPTEFEALGLVQPVPPARKIALLIGNENYAERVGRLNNTVKDVKLLEAKLSELGFEVESVENAGRFDILGAVQRFAGRAAQDPDTAALIYYSGHGVAKAETKESYLVPVDVESVETGDLWKRSVALNEVLSILETTAPNVQHVIVLDACRNELSLGAPDTSPIAQAPEQDTGGDRPEDGETTRGLSRVKGVLPVAGRLSGTLVAYSTLPNTFASDGSVEDEAGPFSMSLSDTLEQPGQDFEDVLKTARFLMRERTGQLAWQVGTLPRPLLVTEPAAD